MDIVGIDSRARVSGTPENFCSQLLNGLRGTDASAVRVDQVRLTNSFRTVELSNRHVYVKVGGVMRYAVLELGFFSATELAAHLSLRTGLNWEYISWSNSLRCSHDTVQFRHDGRGTRDGKSVDGTRGHDRQPAAILQRRLAKPARSCRGERNVHNALPQLQQARHRLLDVQRVLVAQSARADPRQAQHPLPNRREHAARDGSHRGVPPQLLSLRETSYTKISISSSLTGRDSS